MRYLCIFLFMLCMHPAQSQTIIGQWETYDDKTKEKKALIELYEQNQKYFAKIIATYTGNTNAICKECKGAKKNKPIIGLVIIENLEKDGDEFNNGTILDPENGKTYDCYVTLESANKLKVRGFLGLSLLGRTQYWQRKLTP